MEQIHHFIWVMKYSFILIFIMFVQKLNLTYLSLKSYLIIVLILIYLDIVQNYKNHCLIYIIM